MARDHAPFSIGQREDGDAVVFAPRGELDLATAPELEEAVLGVLERGGVVVIDLRELEFMDSSGVRVLIAAHAKAGDGGERLTLVRPPKGGTVDRILEIAGIEQAPRMVDDPAVGKPPGAETPAAGDAAEIVVNGRLAPSRPPVPPFGAPGCALDDVASRAMTSSTGFD